MSSSRRHGLADAGDAGLPSQRSAAKALPDARRETAPAGNLAEILLPDGLVGLPHLRHFRVSPLEGTPFLRLDSLDDPRFAVVAAPVDDVQPGASDALVARGLAASGVVAIALLSVHGDPRVITANLAGPIMVDPDTGTGRQDVLDDAAFPLRAALAVTV